MPSLQVPSGAAPQVYAQVRMTLGFGLDYTVATGTIKLPIPAGYAVEKVCTVVTQAFDGAPTITLGDSTTAAGYLANSDVALNTAATAATPAVKDSSAIANAYQHGKYYTAADNILIAWTKGTSPTAGVLKGWYVLVPLQDLGLTASATAV